MWNSGSSNKRLVAYWLLECLLVFMLRDLRVPTMAVCFRK
jgi:hypothetical protein